MNIFKGAGGFIQGIELDELLAAEADFFQTALEVRRRLGTKAYLLDNYLFHALKIVNARMPVDIVELGREAFGQITREVAVARDGEECGIAQKSQIQDALSYFQAKFQEKYTTSKLAAIRVAPDMLSSLLSEFAKDYMFELLSVYDELRVDALFQEISHSVGEELMERLNAAIKTRFIIAPPINLFFQGFTNYYLDILNSVDIETNKQLFQLILDDLVASQDQTEG